jgi:hypothetical protein
MATDYSYLGAGKISMRVVGSAAPLLEVGNCSALNFNITEDVKELKDFTQPGGGTYNEVRRIQSVEMSMTAHDFSPENLAKALYGTVDAVATTPVADEEIGDAYKGGLLPFAKIPNPATPPVVEAINGDDAVTREDSTAYSQGVYMVPATPNGYYYECTTAGTSNGTPPALGTVIGGTTSDGTVTWTCRGKVLLVVNEDYEVTAGGVRLLEGGAFTEGEPMQASYTPYAGNVVQALTQSGQEYELVFEGLNEARSGKPVIVSVYRGKLGAASQLPFIGEDYGALEMTGKVLKDTSKVGAGVSQYFKVAFAT